MARRWGVSERRVRLMCAEGRIEGAVKLGWSWSIPSDTAKPFDGRVTKQYKRTMVRLGSVDVARLNKLRDESSALEGLSGKAAFDDMAAGVMALGVKMDGLSWSERDILSSFRLQATKTLGAKGMVAAANFRAILLRSPGKNWDWAAKTCLDLRSAWTQGWAEEEGSSFRDGPVEGAEVEVAVQMETFFMQFEREWKGVHPVFKAALLFTELVKDKPFGSHDATFACLMVSSMLLSEGFPPPALEANDRDEVAAATALALKRGNYEDLARIFERCVIDSFGRLGDV